MDAIQRITPTGNVVVFSDDIVDWVVMTEYGDELCSSDCCTLVQGADARETMWSDDAPYINGWNRVRWATAYDFFESHGQVLEF